MRRKVDQQRFPNGGVPRKVICPTPNARARTSSCEFPVRQDCWSTARRNLPNNVFCNLRVSKVYVMPFEKPQLVLDSDTCVAYVRLLSATNESTFQQAAEDLQLYVHDDACPAQKRFSLKKLRRLLQSLCATVALEQTYKGYRVLCSCVWPALR